MAVRDRFIIAPYSSGLENSQKPWLISDDAFQVMRNAFVYRGRVIKRFGAQLMNQSATVPQLASRLRVALAGGAAVGITNGAGNATGTVPGADIATLGKMFSIGNVMYTVYQAGAPVTMFKTDATVTATYNTATGAYNFAGAPATTQIYYYPALPVMGLLTLETEAINDDMLIGFDTQFAYQYVAGAWERLATGGAASVWTGTDAQFFWGTTWMGAVPSARRFFVTNFNYADKIRILDPSTLTWSSITYIVDAAGNTLDTARIILTFKNRLIALNTKETVAAAPTNYPNRCRWSQIGDTLTAATSFLVAPGRGNYYDAPTKETIVSARIVKDRLIVFFEHSTWELVYTSNQIAPFVWQKIDTELGAESTFASVLFDTDIVGVGNVGIHACNGAYVKRIDEKIPDLVFQIHNDNAGVDRVYGIRDYDTQAIYWTFPSQDDHTKFPNRVLVFNYQNRSWAMNDDSITCFGYYQPTTDITWNSISQQWQEYGLAWSSGEMQAKALRIVAGNQEGFTFITDISITRNAPALQITNMGLVGVNLQLQIMAHNLITNDYILIEDAQGSTTQNNKIYQIQTVVDANNIIINEPLFAGTYRGGGTVTRVSQIDISTKEYNFYVKEGRNFSLSRVDFLVDSTDIGEITVDVKASTMAGYTESYTLTTAPYALYPTEDTQERLWHPLYFGAEGFGIQMRIYLNDVEMAKYIEDPVTHRRSFTALAAFQLHSMVIHAQKTSDRIG